MNKTFRRRAVRILFPFGVHSGNKERTTVISFTPKAQGAAAMADELEATKLRTKLLLARRTLLEMLKDRGYWVEETELAMSAEEFLAAFGERPNRRDLGLKTTRISDQKEMFVIFAQEEVVRLTEAKEIVERMHRENVQRAILVLQQRMTPSAKQCLSEARGIEFFEESEVLVNVMRHVLIPKHEILTTSQKKEFLKTEKIKESQLPRMRTDDPMAKYYGLQAGTLTKWFLPGRQVSYRVVVAPTT